MAELNLISGETEVVDEDPNEVPLLQHQTLGDETTMAKTDLTLISGATPSIVRSSPSEISVTEQHQSLQDETTMAETDLTLVSVVHSSEISVTEQHQTLGDETTMAETDLTLVSGVTPSVVSSSPSEISVTEQHLTLGDETTMAETDLTLVSGATPSVVHSSEISVTEQHQSLQDETTMAETDLTLVSGVTPSVVHSSEISVTEQHQTLGDETTMAETDLTLISGATPSTVRSPEISVTEVPFLQQQTLRDESTMKQWENLMIRCHEVIAMLIGFALMFAPIGSIIKALRSEGGQVHPISILKIITIIFRNLEIHLVFPFLFWGLGYGLLYVLSSSSAIPVACVLWMNALSIIVGFLCLFVVIFYISWQFSIGGGIVFGSVIVVLFWKQFPRERVVIRDVESP